MKGILMTPDNIRAIEELRKTVTRRLDGLKEINRFPDDWELMPGHDKESLVWLFRNKEIGGIGSVKPRYQVGEVVYIKEAHAFIYFTDSTTAVAYLDGKAKEIEFQIRNTTDSINQLSQHWHWKSPLFMPEWAARYFIMITAVTPERLQEITEGEAKCEGVDWAEQDIGLRPVYFKSYKIGFITLWDSINKSQKWDTNPFVWRYSFAKADKPIGIERGEDNAS